MNEEKKKGIIMILQDAEEQGENNVCVWIWTSRSNVSDSPMLDPYRPSSLPLSLSIPLSFCLWRLSRRNVSIPKESKKEVALVSVRMCVCVLPACLHNSVCGRVERATVEESFLYCVCRVFLLLLGHKSVYAVADKKSPHYVND